MAGDRLARERPGAAGLAVERRASRCPRRGWIGASSRSRAISATSSGRSSARARRRRSGRLAVLERPSPRSSSRRSCGRPWRASSAPATPARGANGRVIRQLADAALAPEPAAIVELAPRYLHSAAHEGRDRRPRIRGAAARRRIRRGGMRRRGRRHRPPAGRAPAPQRVRRRGRARRSGCAAIAERFTATDDYRSLAAARPW